MKNDFLEPCLESLQHSLTRAKASYEIIIVLNRCSDRSEAIARARDCTIVKEDAKNLSRIRNAGAAAATGKTIVTVDADSTVCASMFEHITRALEDTRVFGGGVLILPERWSLGILCSGLALVPVALWYGISAGLFFARREVYTAIGGFDESKLSVEDIDFARRLKAYARSHGGRFVNLYRAWIVTSCRKFDKFGDWYFLRNLPETLSLFRGKNESLANKIWYDFPRE